MLENSYASDQQNLKALRDALITLKDSRSKFLSQVTSKESSSEEKSKRSLFGRLTNAVTGLKTVEQAIIDRANTQKSFLNEAIDYMEWMGGGINLQEEKEVEMCAPTPISSLNKEEQNIKLCTLFQTILQLIQKDRSALKPYNDFNTSALERMLNHYVSKHPVDRTKWDEAKLLKAISEKDSDAMYVLARQKEKKVKGYTNPTREIIDYYESAAALGHPLAMYRLARYWAKSSFETARKLFLEAKPGLEVLAGQGNPDAQVSLARYYSPSEGSAIPREPNLEKAAQLYELAAEQGHAVAQYELGECYAKGLGVPKNQKEAFKQFKLAVDHDEVHTNALPRLAHYYELGFGTAEEAHQIRERVARHTSSRKSYKNPAQNQNAATKKNTEKAQELQQPVVSMHLPTDKNRTTQTTAPATTKTRERASSADNSSAFFPPEFVSPNPEVNQKLLSSQEKTTIPMVNSSS